MSISILDNARVYLVKCLKDRQNSFETKHPWRKDWEFAVLHSLRVESYVQDNPGYQLESDAAARVLEMIADHSKKDGFEQDFGKGF
jgi:hypothetical protein